MTILDEVIKWLSVARYNVTPPTTVDGETQELQCTQEGYLKVQVAEEKLPQVHAVSTAKVKEEVLGPVPCILHAFSATNDNASLQYLHVFDAATVRSNGDAAALYKVAIPAKTTYNFTVPKGQIVITSGVCFHASTTLADLTKPAGDDFIFTVDYTGT